MIFIGGVAAAALAAVAGLHVIWMASPWPLRTRSEFARKVVGVAEDGLPGPALTAVVAGLLFAAAYLVAAHAGIAPVVGPDWIVLVGTSVVAGVLLLRGLVGLVVSLRRETEFAYYDRRLYSPLCIVLGAMCGVVALG